MNKELESKPVGIITCIQIVPSEPDLDNGNLLKDVPSSSLLQK